jgi:hypothetical protein
MRGDYQFTDEDGDRLVVNATRGGGAFVSTHSPRSLDGRIVMLHEDALVELAIACLRANGGDSEELVAAIGLLDGSIKLHDLASGPGFIIPAVCAGQTPGARR